jgi:hypothetical protein
MLPLNRSLLFYSSTNFDCYVSCDVNIYLGIIISNVLTFVYVVINKYLEKLQTRLNSFRTFIAKFKAHDYINGVKMEFYDGKTH